MQVKHRSLWRYTESWIHVCFFTVLWGNVAVEYINMNLNKCIGDVTICSVSTYKYHWESYQKEPEPTENYVIRVSLLILSSCVPIISRYWRKCLVVQWSKEANANVKRYSNLPYLVQICSLIFGRIRVLWQVAYYFDKVKKNNASYRIRYIAYLWILLNYLYGSYTECVLKSPPC